MCGIYEMRKIKRKKQRFTLIELLITIAIIAILASVLMPALRQALNKGYSINCLSNMKQANLAIEFYAQDNNDCVLDAWMMGNYEGAAYGGVQWNNYLVTKKYVAKKSYLQCPVLSSMNSNAKGPFMYSNIATEYGGYKCKRSTWKNAGSKVMIVDGVKFEFGTHWDIWFWYQTTKVDQGVDARHQLATNVLWRDGHATSLPMSQRPPDSNGICVGRAQDFDPAY